MSRRRQMGDILSAVWRQMTGELALREKRVRI